jgi:hypothetical protein
MQKMIAMCGLICNDCPAYIATQKDDDEARKKVTEEWSSEQYPLSPEDINCDGCLAMEKRLCKFCIDCETRQCGLEKGIDNCAYCDEFPCEKLEKHWKMMNAYEAKARLEELRKTFSI